MKKLVVRLSQVCALAAFVFAIYNFSTAPTSTTLATIAVALLLSVSGIALATVNYRMNVQDIPLKKESPDWGPWQKACAALFYILLFASLGFKFVGN